MARTCFRQPNLRTLFVTFVTFVTSGLLMSGTPVAAAADLTIRVSDASGGRLPGARVALVNAATGFEQVGRTGDAGTFAFPGLGSGPFELAVAAGGFAPVERLLEADASVVEVTLEPAPVVEQVTVVSGSRVVERRESLNTRVEVVSRERIRDTGYESVAEVLREVPGVSTRVGSETAGAAGQQVQGIGSRQVLVLLDGQPLAGARGIKRGVLNLDRQSVGRLDRIEVVKGAASALYGSDAIGGVINLITRDPDGPLETSLVTAAGDQGVVDARGQAAFSNERLHGLATLERHQRDGFDLTPTTPDTTGADTRRWDSLAKLGVELSETARLTALFDGYWGDSQGRSFGELGPQASRFEESGLSGGLSLDWRLRPRTALQLRAYHTRYEEISENALLDPAGPPLETGELRQRLFKLDASVSHVIGERQLFQAGAEWWADEYGGVNRLRDEQGNEFTTSVLWAQDRINLHPKLTLTLGLRFDDNSAFGSALSPKAALLVRPADVLSLRFSYGRGFRTPDLGQLYYRFLNPTNFYQVIGNPDLDPEHADSFQLGGELSLPNGRARLGVNLFRNEVDDLIEAVTLGFVATPGQLEALIAAGEIDPSFRPALGRLLFAYRNVDRVRTQGLELDGEVALGAGFAFGAAYTFLDTEDRETGLELTSRSAHNATARIAWENPATGSRLNLRGTYLSSWIVRRSATPDGVTVETRAPGFSLWDVYAAQRIRDGVEAYAAVDNLTDNQDPNTGLLDADGSPLALYRAEVGRTFRVGLRLEWAR